MAALLKITWLRPGLTVLDHRKRFELRITRKGRVAGPIGGFFFLRTAPQLIERADWTCLNTSRNPKKLVTRVNFVVSGGDLWKQNKNRKVKLKIGNKQNKNHFHAKKKVYLPVYISDETTSNKQHW